MFGDVGDGRHCQTPKHQSSKNFWLIVMMIFMIFFLMFLSIKSNNFFFVFSTISTSYTGPVMVVKLSSIRKRLLASMIDYFFILFLFDQFRMLIAELFDYDIPL